MSEEFEYGRLIESGGLGEGIAFYITSKVRISSFDPSTPLEPDSQA